MAVPDGNGTLKHLKREKAFRQECMLCEEGPLSPSPSLSQCHHVIPSLPPSLPSWEGRLEALYYSLQCVDTSERRHGISSLTSTREGKGGFSLSRKRRKRACLRTTSCHLTCLHARLHCFLPSMHAFSPCSFCCFKKRGTEGG